MQTAYTGYFSGPDSASLPEEVKAQQQEFEKAFLQMSTLATKLAEYQQTIAKTIAGQKPPATTYAAVVGNAGSSTGPAAVGTAPAAGNSGGSEIAPAGVPTEGNQAVEQAAVQAPPAPAVGTARTTSPDRGAGGQEGQATVPSLQESKGQNDKRAEDCSVEELMQRRPANKLAKIESATEAGAAAGATAMEVEPVA